MKDNELWEWLKSAKAPEQSEEYRRDFPKKVTAKLHWQKADASVRSRDSRLNGDFKWAWSLAVLLLAAVIAVAVDWSSKHAKNGFLQDQQLTEARKCYQEFKALFPNQLTGIVFDQKGPTMMLADQPVVPDSTAFYLKICVASGCKEFVTFSGQQIRVNGESCEVLADAEGQLMVVGENHIWRQNDSTDSIRIEAAPLEAKL